MRVPELVLIATKLGIKGAVEVSKQDLIYKILDKQAIIEGRPRKITDAYAGQEFSQAKEFPEAKPKRKTIPKAKEQDRFPALNILIDPGTAPNEEIASVLADLSRIYRRMGGSGITFKLDAVTLNQEEGVYES